MTTTSLLFITEYVLLFAVFVLINAADDTKVDVDRSATTRKEKAIVIVIVVVVVVLEVIIMIGVVAFLVSLCFQ